MLPGIDQKKIVVALFVLTLVFLIANIVADKFVDKRDVPVIENMNNDEINSKFVSAVRVFGIAPSWINTKTPGKKDPASLIASYSINVPSDLPIALLVREISNSYDTVNVKMIVNETKIKGVTSVKIFSKGSEIITADFSYKDGLKRKAGSVGFLLNDFSDLNRADDSVLLKSPENFAVIMQPSKKAKNLSSQILKSGKEFVILLDDDIPDLIYKLNSGYSEARLKNSIRTILGDFPNAVFMMIDDNSSLFSSSAYELIKKEMEKRNIKLVKRSSFRELNPDNLRDYLDSINDGETRSVIISAGDFLKINSTMVSFRKIGYKFINPSLAIK